MKPTCANLRNEFRLLFNAGCDELDKRMIKEFLNLNFNQELSDTVVKKCDSDKFKALCNFLKKGIKSHERSIELLAWLINFPGRPFSNFWRKKEGKPDLLSEITISERGILAEFDFEFSNNQHYRSIGSVESTNKVSSMFQEVIKKDEDAKVAELQSNIVTSPFVQKEITLEYPSGVKLSVGTADLELIAQLIKL